LTATVPETKKHHQLTKQKLLIRLHTQSTAIYD